MQYNPADLFNLSTIMEHFFAPTRRYQDLFGLETFEYTEVELNVPVKDFRAWNWEYLRAFVAVRAIPTILWITREVFLVVVLNSGDMFAPRDDMISDCIYARFEETTGHTQTLQLASIAHANRPVSTREVGVFWRAIMTSNSVKVIIVNDGLLGEPSGEVPRHFLHGRRTSLQKLVFWGFHFKEEHCRTLATIHRTDLDISLCQCTLEPQDEIDTFIEWFRHNQVITYVDLCSMESGIFSALSGNNSLKRLVIHNELSDFGEEEMRSLLQALPGNKGFEDLTFYNFDMSEEPWSLLFRSLSTHPRIKALHILHNYGLSVTYSAGARSTVMNAILKMLQHNTVAQTIRLPDAFNDEAVYHNAILPRLEMNRSCFEVQRLAVTRADPSIRPQLLGRALHVVQYNSDLVFRFLSENVPAFVQA